MTVYFGTTGQIDLDVIRTMGVSVKETENPIGFFGTGLKYAIATLLRTGHKIILKTGDRMIEFTTKPKEIRGKTFNVVFMGEEQLGFTTELGKNWEVWQAYRELYSNTIDELGTITSNHIEYETMFIVSGPEIDQVHSERSKIFLMNEPWITHEQVEVHRGQSNYLYYRGVRVATLVKPTRFTYNLICDMRLTEDRTLASIFDANYKLSMRLPRIPNEVFCEKIIDPSWEGYEKTLNFEMCHNPSEEFLETLEKHRSDARLNESYREMLLRHRKVSEFDVFQLDEVQMKTVKAACDLLKKLDCNVSIHDFVYVEYLGPGILAMAKDGKMFLTRQSITNGADFLAITMYEEWIHNKLGFEDCSRGMQQFLFDKILELIKREK